MTDPAGVRRELDQLAGWLVRLEGRVEDMDRSGTRGMGAVQVQISDLSKDLGELAGTTRTWEHAHDMQHAEDAAERTRGRRWLLTLGVAGVTALGGLYPLIALLASRHLRAHCAHKDEGPAIPLAGPSHRPHDGGDNATGSRARRPAR